MVTVIIHNLLNEREKTSMLNKLNMIIGAFFSEVGTHLLKSFAEFDASSDEIAKEFVLKSEWSGRDFAKARRLFKNYKCQTDVRKGDIEVLKGFLTGKRNFLLRLLENPNLLEHKTFTDLLWAVFHLTEELVHRKDLRVLPETDLKHLTGDIKRAYVLLILEWLAYMNHLKKEYPYLYSLALRTNPFDQKAQIEVA